MSSLSAEERATLRQFLVERFNLDELKNLAFDLSVDYEMFPHQTKSEFARGLISYFERKGNLSCLVAQIIKLRPDDEMTRLLASLGGCRPRTKVQVILSNDKLKSRPDLVRALAQLLGVGADEVSLIATAAGSIRLLIGIPAEAAGKLDDLDLPHQLADEYEIIGVKQFDLLGAAEQEAWRTAAARGMADAGVIGRGLSLPGGWEQWWVRLLVWLAGGAVMVVGVKVSLPTVTVINHCPILIDERYPAPVIGEVRVFLPSGGRETFAIPPGRYEFAFSSDGEVTADVPFVGKVGPFPAGEELPVTFQGRPVLPGQTQAADAGLFASYTLELCPTNGR
ncbi:MAG: hypothetical protein ACE5E7_08315 [Anaerolineae bacterium]